MLTEKNKRYIYRSKHQCAKRVSFQSDSVTTKYTLVACLRSISEFGTCAH